MAEVWKTLRGDDGRGGMAGTLSEIREWQVAKDAADDARADVIKDALDRHNRSWFTVSVIIAIAMLLIAAMDFYAKTKDHTLVIPGLSQSEPETAQEQYQCAFKW